MAIFRPLNPNNEKFYFFSSFRGKKFHCTRKIRLYILKISNQKFDIFLTLCDEKNNVLGYKSSSGWNFSNMFAYLKTREKNAIGSEPIDFFLSSRKSGQNRTRRSKF